jgi:hypothetical protein
VIPYLSNGLPVSSLFCYTTLLFLHQCIPPRIILHFLFFSLSLHAHLSILFYAHESQLKNTLLFSVLHIFIMPSPLLDHAHNSSSSLEVIVFDTFPSVNCLYDESSFHWQLSRDSSAPLAITLKLFEFSGRYLSLFVISGIILRFFGFSSSATLCLLCYT